MRRKFLVIVGTALLVLPGAGLLFTWFGAGVWFLESAAYFVPAYAMLAICATACCAAGRSRAGTAAGLALACAAGIMLLPQYQVRNPAAASAPNLRVLQANVYDRASVPDRFLRLVRDERPDIVLLQEANEAWDASMRALDYAHHALIPRYANGRPNLGLYWRAELKPPVPLSSRGIPAVMLEITVNGAPVRVFNVHTASPWSPRRALHHREQMQELARCLAEIDTPAIVAGDLNTSPWSPLYKRLLARTGLISARQGFGVLGTWPTFPGVIRTSIDHLLVSPAIGVVRCRVGPHIGSDHRPLLTDLSVPDNGQ